MGNKLAKMGGGGGDSKFTKPTGLYATCEWDDKAVKKLIQKKKVAPRYPGREDAGPDLDECPICFLWYPGGLNRSKCCKQPICTECYLQFKKPNSQKQVTCPFCNALNYAVKYTGSISKEERQQLEQEEQRVIHAKMLARKAELERQAEREKEVAAERSAERERRAQEALAAPAPPSSDAVPERRPVSASLGSRSADAVDHRAPTRPYSAGHSHLRHHPHRSDYVAETEEGEDSGAGMDVEELMILEAIRLSLLDNQQQASHRDGQSDDETGSDDDQAGAANLASDDDEAGASHLGRAGVASDYEHSHSQVSESEDGDALAGQENQEDFEEAWPAVSWAVEHSQAFENSSRSTFDAAASSASVDRPDTCAISRFEEVMEHVVQDEAQDDTLDKLLRHSLLFFGQASQTADASLAATQALLSSPAALGRLNRMPQAVETNSTLSPSRAPTQASPTLSPLSSMRASSEGLQIDSAAAFSAARGISSRSAAGPAPTSPMPANSYPASASENKEEQSSEDEEEMNESFGPKNLEDEAEQHSSDILHLIPLAGESLQAGALLQFVDSQQNDPCPNLADEHIKTGDGHGGDSPVSLQAEQMIQESEAAEQTDGQELTGEVPHSPSKISELRAVFEQPFKGAEESPQRQLTPAKTLSPTLKARWSALELASATDHVTHASPNTQMDDDGVRGEHVTSAEAGNQFNAEALSSVLTRTDSIEECPLQQAHEAAVEHRIEHQLELAPNSTILCDKEEENEQQSQNVDPANWHGASGILFPPDGDEKISTASEHDRVAGTRGLSDASSASRTYLAGEVEADASQNVAESAAAEPDGTEQHDKTSQADKTLAHDTEPGVASARSETVKEDASDIVASEQEEKTEDALLMTCIADKKESLGEAPVQEKSSEAVAAVIKSTSEEALEASDVVGHKTLATLASVQDSASNADTFAEEGVR